MNPSSIDPKRIVQRATIQLVRRHPFYSTRLLKMAIRWDVPGTGCNTMGTNGRELLIYSDWLLSLAKKASGKDELVEWVMFILAHEALHVYSLHHIRQGGRNAKIWNYAGDYAINSVLVDSGLNMPPEGLIDAKYKDLASEAIYTQLVEEMSDDDSGQGKPGDGEPGDGEPGDGAPGLPEGKDQRDNLNGVPWGDVLPAPTGIDPEVESKELEVEARQALLTAKGCGNLPGNIKRLIDDLFEPPKADWRELLRRFSDGTAKQETSWARPDRRMLHTGMILPSPSFGGISKLVVAVDTSGSINTRALGEFMVELDGIRDDVHVDELVLLPFDTGVRNDISIFPGTDLSDFKDECTGGGGTDFRPVLAYAEENHGDLQALIIFTDLGAYEPDEPQYPVLWAIEPGIRQDAWFGESIHLD